MTRRLLAGYLSLTAFLLLVLAVPLGMSFASAERRHLVDDVRHDALVLAMAAQEKLRDGKAGDLAGLADEYRRRTDGRVTIVDASGNVLADSDPLVPGPRNFDSRPEIAAALRNQESSGVRHSNTLGHDLVYVAIPLTGEGKVEGAVRITYPSSFVDARILRRWLSLAGVALFALGVTFIVVVQLTRSVVRPLRQLQATASRLGQGTSPPARRSRPARRRRAPWPRSSTPARSSSNGWSAPSGCSWPTPPTSCARRWPRCACGSRTSRPTSRRRPGRTSTARSPRCGGCPGWSTGCSPSPGPSVGRPRNARSSCARSSPSATRPEPPSPTSTPSACRHGCRRRWPCSPARVISSRCSTT